MTNEELEARIRELVKIERTITHEVLKLIQEAEDRRLFLKRGYSSSFDWLVKEYGISQPSAYRRIRTSRLMRVLPEVGKKVERGELNLVNAALMQSTFDREEKRIGKTLPVDQKRKILAKIEGKTQEQAQKLLVTEYPESVVKNESLRAIDKNSSRLSIIIEDEALKLLQRAREVLSHSIPDASWVALIQYLAESYLRKNDPLRKLTHPMATVANHCVIPENTRRLILQRANAQCEFIDEETNHRCECRQQIEIDHIKPKALGGGNEPENLRALCRSHNLYEAEKIFGQEKMNSYRARTAR